MSCEKFVSHFLYKGEFAAENCDAEINFYLWRRKNDITSSLYVRMVNPVRLLSDYCIP